MKIGFISALLLLFIGLKLGGVIAWSWLWVLSPIWLPVVVVLSLPILAFICLYAFAFMSVIIESVKKKNDKRKHRNF